MTIENKQYRIKNHYFQPFIEEKENILTIYFERHSKFSILIKLDYRIKPNKLKPTTSG